MPRIGGRLSARKSGPPISTIASLALCIALLSPVISLAADGTTQWPLQSEGTHVRATLEPRIGSVEIGAFQPWILTLEDSQGAALEQAQVVLGGGMPGHGHGLPTQPVVTDYLGGGRYLIEGIKLNMAGRWVVAVAASTPVVRDRLIFEFDIDIWSAGERQLLASLFFAPTIRPPSSPSNRVADNPDAAHFGKLLFFDQRLSTDGTMSCASCHQPDRYFTDGKPRGVGVRRAGRNTPTVVGAAYLSWLYWDGRRDSLWSQALVPFEAADEMGSSRLAVIRIVGSDEDYRPLYESLFGEFPDDVLSADLPLHAGPLGDTETRAAWQRIDSGLAQQINTVYTNIGKAIAAYERALSVPLSRFDRYVSAVLAGDREADTLFDSDESAGLELFLDAERTHCLRCHNGPWFTNGGFHNIGTGRFAGPELDFGRVFGLRSVIMDEFNCLGSYSDAKPEECSELRFLNRNSHVPLEGAFKVPSLRNIEATAPYMHDGRFTDLKSVIEFYRKPPDNSQGGGHELQPLDISDAEARQLVAFLKTLSNPAIEN